MVVVAWDPNVAGSLSDCYDTSNYNNSLVDCHSCLSAGFHYGTSDDPTLKQCYSDWNCWQECGQNGPPADDLLTGSIVYICIAVASILILRILGTVKGWNSEEHQLGMILGPIAVFQLWLMWCFVWLTQWHPLISPEAEIGEG
jgi:hypothetical protein